jgi:outer membrane biosynthesis protein TonB
MSTLLYAMEPVMPWAPVESEDRRFRRILISVCIFTLLVGLAMPFLPVIAPEHAAAPVLPPRVAKLVVERQQQPPPPPLPRQEEPKAAEPKPKVEPKPEVRPTPKPREVSQPRPEPQSAAEARERASGAGVLAFREALSDLRQDDSLAKLEQQQLSTGGDTAAKTERAMVTSSAGKSSGGIDTAALSRDTAGGGGRVAERKTTAVESTVGGAATARVSANTGLRATRTDEEIQLVFDRNKSAIYALYNRALRSNPALRGQMV